MRPWRILARAFRAARFSGDGLITLFIVLLVVAGLSVSFSSSALAAEEHGYITGKVTAAATGTPIAGVKVCAINRNGVGPWGCTTTDTKGEYTASVFEDGSYYVHFTTPSGSGYVERSYYNNKYSEAEQETVIAVVGYITPDIDAELPEGGQIIGTVTNAETQAPLAEVEVCGGPVACALTNARGEYAISGLPGGEYQVSFGFGYGGGLGEKYVAPEYYKNNVFPTLADEPTKVRVPTGGVAAGIDQEMQEFSRMSGRVISASTKAPVAGIQVEAYTGYTGQSSVTNSNGEYTISHLADRSQEYSVSFTVPSNSGIDYFSQYYGGPSAMEWEYPVKLALGNDVSGIDAELEEGGQITGRVTNVTTKAGIEEVRVCPHSRIIYEGHCVMTNANGEYDITALPTGEYEVSFSIESSIYFPQGYERDVPVTVGHTTTGIDVALEPVVDGVITGYAQNNLTKKGIGGIEVCAYEMGREELFGQCATTGADGGYRIGGLSSGKYLVEFYSPTGSGLNYAPRYYDERVSSLYAQEVSVTAGHYTPGIDANLEEAGKATGRVTSAVGKAAIKGIEVCFITRNEELVGCLLTNSDGEYVTPPLARGEYKVSFDSPFESGLNYVEQYYGGASSWNDALAVSIEAGATSSGIGAELSEGGGISGRVTNAWTGEPIKDAVACALAKYDGFGACAATDDNGEYNIESLAGGEYAVGFAAGKNYVVQYYDKKSPLSAAEQVSVTVGDTHDDIDAALQPSDGASPHNTVSPAVSGVPSVGDVLSCSPGSWTGDPAPTYSYSWLRDGIAMNPVSSTDEYTVQKADEGSRIECEVTAENIEGSERAFSLGVYISRVSAGPPPPPPSPPPLGLTVPSTGLTTSTSTMTGTVTPTTAPPTTAPEPGQVTLTDTSITTRSDGDATVKLACAGAGTCSGRLALTIASAGSEGTGHVATAKNRKTEKRRIKTITIGTAAFSIPVGKSATVSLALDPAGRALLKADHGRLKASLMIVESSAGNTSTRHEDVRLVLQSARSSAKSPRRSSGRPR